MDLNPYIVNIFVERILAWHKTNSRDYPWRRTRDPYHILISELMLRRTRADQVVPVYHAFLKQYPDSQTLSGGRPATIRQILKPLGLSWRAENFVKVSRELIQFFDGRIPSDEKALQQLTGVGDYVAGAVSCFAFEKPVPMIDTNIVRVIGRIFGLDLRGEARRRKEVRDAAVTCLERAQPREYHYALLDFGALVCTARNPKCEACPIGREHCRHGRASNQHCDGPV